jgi:hypothetical protein
MKPVALNSDDNDCNRSSLIRINITTSPCMKSLQLDIIKNGSSCVFFFRELFHSCLWIEYQIRVW